MEGTLLVRQKQQKKQGLWEKNSIETKLRILFPWGVPVTHRKCPIFPTLGKSRHLGFSRWRLSYGFSPYFSFQMTQAQNLSGQTYVFWDEESNGNTKNTQIRDQMPILIGQNVISSHICYIFQLSLWQKQALDNAEINRKLSNAPKNWARPPSFQKSMLYSKRLIIKSLNLYVNMAGSKKCLQRICLKRPRLVVTVGDN